ncbi:hypothetical protein BDW60DRAFT_183140 [Aspergillus nidulans var. acristatus]
MPRNRTESFSLFSAIWPAYRRRILNSLDSAPQPQTSVAQRREVEEGKHEHNRSSKRCKPPSQVLKAQ